MVPRSFRPLVYLFLFVGGNMFKELEKVKTSEMEKTISEKWEQIITFPTGKSCANS